MPLPAPLRFLRLATTGLALSLLVPLWWLIPGLWAGWWLGGRRARDAAAPTADERFVAALPLGFALPALFLPLARLLHLPWKEAWLALALAGAAVGLRRLVRAAATPGDGPPPPWPALTFAAAALGLACWWPLRGLLAPAGVDMAMHLTFARLLWQQAAVPLTQAPIWPNVPLGAYPLGFHGATALSALVAGDVLRAGLIVTAATHALVPIAVYLCVKRSGRDAPAAVAALLAGWIARNPQAFVGWGGNPCALGIALALVSARLLVAPPAGRAAWSGALEAGLLAAAAALVHPTPAALLPYAVALALPAAAWLGLTRLEPTTLKRLALAGLVAAVFVAPQLPASRATEISGAEIAWVRDHHRAPPQAPAPGLTGAARYVKGQYDDALVVVFLVLAVANATALRRTRAELAGVAGVAALTALAALAAAWRLPPALMLYPDRMMPFALPIFALTFRRSLEAARGWAARPGAGRGRAVAAVALCALLCGLAGAKHVQFYDRKARDGSFVTPADRLAMAWIGDHAPPGVLVDTNYGDAGAWLPAAVGCAVTRPQVNPVWFEEMAAARAAMPVVLRFRGARLWVGADSVGTRLSEADVVFRGRAGADTAVVARAGGRASTGLNVPAPDSSAR